MSKGRWKVLQGMKTFAIFNQLFLNLILDVYQIKIRGLGAR